MSTLALLFEGSACSWGRLALIHGSETINDIIRALVKYWFCYYVEFCTLGNRFLFNSSRDASLDASNEMLNAIRNTLRNSAKSDDDRMGSPLAAVFSQAMCHLKRIDGFPSSNSEGTTSVPSCRVIIVTMTEDFGTEHDIKGNKSKN
ncbi:hypothetical protein DICVIV_00750 [Dictyocaulus viviparus]|uniref:Uncharacterized protein n=1 Tax=Dictyocaulus viviparus TaxID=29172 RepID=A0A0D8Y8L0_DICVI|nr:hypothetical protein DICVIV_00750 [Dictyocaulus viviparus]